jgi:hypothetical protein
VQIPISCIQSQVSSICIGREGVPVFSKLYSVNCIQYPACAKVSAGETSIRHPVSGIQFTVSIIRYPSSSIQ